MEQKDWLVLVASKHKEWVKIVKSFGEKNYAEDIVQETYINLIKYSSIDKVIKNEKINKGYMFICLRSNYYQFYNKKKKIKKIYIDELYMDLIDDTDLEEQKAFHDICIMIDKEISNWEWYDRELFKTYRDTDLSIRAIAKKTDISYVSIFNTLKNKKDLLKLKFGKQWEKYKKQ